jgi:hypothetical protein
MIKRIIATTEAMERFWRRAHGWAPAEAADMLAAARLDRQVSFTHTPSDCHKPFAPQESEARLILGYVTLRALCEEFSNSSSLFGGRTTVRMPPPRKTRGVR